MRQVTRCRTNCKKRTALKRLVPVLQLSSVTLHVRNVTTMAAHCGVRVHCRSTMTDRTFVWIVIRSLDLSCMSH